MSFWTFLAELACADSKNGAPPLTGTTSSLSNEEQNHYNLNFFDKK